MVILQPNSVIDPKKYPFIHKWDSNVRKHYKTYQTIIDAHTYRLQRIQRNIFVNKIII
jgi:hypothetical protein